MGDQVLFAVRFVCSYVTFYRFEISNNYFRELAVGLPANEHIIMTRWPAQNNKTSGINLKTVDDVVKYFVVLLQCVIISRQLINSTYQKYINKMSKMNIILLVAISK